MVDKSQHLSIFKDDSLDDPDMFSKRMSTQTGRRGNVTRSSHANMQDF